MKKVSEANLVPGRLYRHREDTRRVRFIRYYTLPNGMKFTKFIWVDEIKKPESTWEFNPFDFWMEIPVFKFGK